MPVIRGTLEVTRLQLIDLEERMELYWEQVVQNILGGNSCKKDDTAKIMSKTVDDVIARIAVKKDLTNKKAKKKDAAVQILMKKEEIADEIAKITVKKDVITKIMLRKEEIKECIARINMKKDATANILMKNKETDVAIARIIEKKDEVNDVKEATIMSTKLNDDVKVRKKRASRKDLKVEKVEISLKNLSLTPDEGIDISYCTPIFPIMTSIPQVIMRPQHQLEGSWTFWYSVGNKSLSWVHNQVEICTVTTIEQFWYVTSQLQPPSNIPSGHTYSVFRTGVLPDWEDVANVNGGRWMISWRKGESMEGPDSMWLQILIAMVGEHMGEFSGLVNGAEACVRKKGNRLEVWLADVVMMKGVVEVGRQLKNKLGLDAKRKMKFSLHKEDKEGVKGPRLAL